MNTYEFALLHKFILSHILANVNAVFGIIAKLSGKSVCFVGENSLSCFNHEPLLHARRQKLQSRTALRREQKRHVTRPALERKSNIIKDKKNPANGVLSEMLIILFCFFVPGDLQKGAESPRSPARRTEYALWASQVIEKRI